MRDQCQLCLKLRPLKRVMGGKLGPKGLDICRPCTKALKFAAVSR
jgi:hypothetical protein